MMTNYYDDEGRKCFYLTTNSTHFYVRLYGVGYIMRMMFKIQVTLSHNFMLSSIMTLIFSFSLSFYFFLIYLFI